MGIIVCDSFSKKKSEVTEPNQDNYKYISEESVKGLVFFVNTSFKKCVQFFKDVVMIKSFWVTLAVRVNENIGIRSVGGKNISELQDLR